MRNFRARLQSGLPQFGFNLMYPTPGIVERLGRDWDWIWVDGQHGQMGYSEILSVVRACDLVDRPALVRVPGHDAGMIGLVLDSGAQGVIVPMVDTAGQAAALVAAAKFPSLGNRSYGGRRPIDLYGREYSKTANEETLLIAQIESPEAMDDADAIAALPGVDVLFLGPDDMSLRRGAEMGKGGSKDFLASDMKRLSDACRKHGKFSMISAAASAEMLAHSIELGFNLIVCGGDMRFLSDGSKAASAGARKLQQELAGKAAVGKRAEIAYSGSY